MKKKNILITGGSGFIASHVVDELIKKGHNLTVLDKKKSNFINSKSKIFIGDIKNLKTLNKIFRFKDIVFHFVVMLIFILLIGNILIQLKIIF